LICDSNIVGLLGFPEYDPRYFNAGVTNTVVAIVRAMSGSAVMQSGNGTNMAFRYQMTVENVPWNSIGYYSTNFNDYSGVPSYWLDPDWITRSNRWAQAQYLTNSLHEVRLKFAWPVFPNGNVGPNRQSYRTLVSSFLWMTNNALNSYPLWFFQPQLYTTNIYNVSRLN
jgi:hypothetical protein